MEGFSSTLKDGREIYIPYWPVDISLQNLTKAGQYLGTESVIRISEKNIPSAIVAITEATEPERTALLVKHFVCQARVDGNKITPEQVDSYFMGKLGEVLEIFTLVVHAQYYDFFKSGLVKEPSQQSLEEEL